ncbi:MAG: hypothetical protein U1E86_16225 [Burkholderiaceae bacterium]
MNPIDQFVELEMIPGLAFPNDLDSPAFHFERSLLLLIAASIGIDLFRPVLRIRPRLDSTMSAIVPMPKASVHEDDCLGVRQNDIGRTRQLSVMQAKPKSACVQKATHGDLRGGILTPDAFHQRGSARIGCLLTNGGAGGHEGPGNSGTNDECAHTQGQCRARLAVPLSQRHAFEGCLLGRSARSADRV